MHDGQREARKSWRNEKKNEPMKLSTMPRAILFYENDEKNNFRTLLPSIDRVNNIIAFALREI